MTAEIVSAYVRRLAECDSESAFLHVRASICLDTRLCGGDFLFLGQCFSCFYDDFQRKVNCDG